MQGHAQLCLKLKRDLNLKLASKEAEPQTAGFINYSVYSVRM